MSVCCRHPVLDEQQLSAVFSQIMNHTRWSDRIEWTTVPSTPELRFHHAAQLHFRGRQLYLPHDLIGSLQDEAEVALLERVEQTARSLIHGFPAMAHLAAEYEVVLIAAHDGARAADIRPLVRPKPASDRRRTAGNKGSAGRRTFRILAISRMPYCTTTQPEAVHQAVINLHA